MSHVLVDSHHGPAWKDANTHFTDRKLRLRAVKWHEEIADPNPALADTEVSVALGTTLPGREPACTKQPLKGAG